MPALSQGASLAWHLGAREAARTKQPYIETAEVFVGICRLGMWLRTKPAEKGHMPLAKYDERRLRLEADAVEEVLRAFTLSPERLRHTVRVARGGSEHAPGRNAVLHRSADCKTAFQRAEAMAATTQAPEVHCLHLLAALLEHPGAFLTRVLALFIKDIPAMQTRVLAVAGRLDRQQAVLDSKGLGVSHLIYRPAGFQ